MTADTPSGRLPASSVPAAWLRHLPSIVGLLVAALLYGTRSDLWPGRWAWILIGFLLLLRIAHPLATWATLRFDVTDERALVRTGLLVTRTRTASWASISVVDVEEPWAYRVLGLSIVRLHTGGEDDTTLSIVGLDRASAAFVAQCARATTDAAPRETPEEIYRANSTELLIGSAAYGQFLIAGVGAVLATSDLLDTLGLWDSTLGLARTAPAVWAAGAFVILMLAGFVLTLVRYHGFVVVRVDGRLVITHGLFSRRERILDGAAIVGGRIQRNLVEMVFDRARVSLHSIDTMRQSTVNLVLPSLPRGTVARIVAECLPDLAPGALLTSPGQTSILRSVATATVIIAAATAGVVATTTLTPVPLGVAILMSVACGFVVLATARIVVARLQLRDFRLVRSCSSFVDREDIVRLDALHVVSTVGFGRHAPVLVRAHFFAGIPRTLTAFSRDAAIARRTTELLMQISPTAGARKRLGKGAAS